MLMHTHDHTHPQGAASYAEDMQASEKAPACSDASRLVTREAKTTQTHEITNQTQDSIFPRFDWYSATIQKEVEPVRVLRWAQLFGDPTPMKAFHGYDECMDFGQLKILYGGMNGPHGVHVIIHGGDACQAIVEAFREAFPEHYPTRIDVCFDFQGEKAYDKLFALALKTKRKFDIQSEKMGDWIDKKRGRSFKLGGKKSTYQAIIYEKGHEQRQKNVNPDAPLDWVRVEFRIHPTSASKVTASQLQPEQIARSGRWTDYLCDLLGATSVPRVKLDTRNKKPRCVESAENMYRQYQRKIAETVRDKYVPRAAHFAALTDILDGKEFTGFGPEVYREWFF